MKVNKGYFEAAGPLETPYAPARATWDTTVGGPTVAAYHWRLAFFALVVLLTLAIGGLIYRAGQSKVLPVYVGIDSLGQARVIATPQTSFKPTDTSVAFHVRQFVMHVWSVSSDPAKTKQGWIEAFHFASAKGQQQLKGEVGEWLDRPAELALKGTVVIVPEQPLKVTADSWQVDWIRTPRDVNGNAGKPTKFRGTFHVVTAPPKTAKDVMNNPLGVYVDDFSRIEL